MAATDSTLCRHRAVDRGTKKRPSAREGRSYKGYSQNTKLGWGYKGARLGTHRIHDIIIESRSHLALNCGRGWLNLLGNDRVHIR